MKGANTVSHFKMERGTSLETLYPVGKESSCNARDTGSLGWEDSLSWEDSLEEGMATHSSILA